MSEIPTPETPEDVARMLEQVEAAIARKEASAQLQEESIFLMQNFDQFVRHAWNELEPLNIFMPNWHIDAICEHLNYISTSKLRRLQIWLPPGHMKSRLVSVLWPAWEWTHSPSMRYWTGSYDIRLATEMATYARDLMLTPWYQERWGDMFRFKKTTEDYYTNDQAGHRISNSPDKGGIGIHGHRIIIDDGCAAKDADSVTMASLERTNNWYSNTMSGRGLPGYAEVIIMQRLHERDLAAHAMEFAEWTVLCLPEVYEKAHPFAWERDPRQEGELLWPQRRDWEEHLIMERKLGSKASGQLQQRPASREGDILPRSAWRYYPAEFLDAAENGDVKKLPKFQSIVCSWDTSFKDKSSSDFVAGGAWGILGANRYLLKVFHEKASLSRTKTEMVAMREWCLRRWPQIPIRLLIEKSANGVEIIDQLKREIPGVVPFSASTDKVTRAEACEPDFSSENVWVPGRANVAGSDYDPSTPSWVQRVIEECVVGETLIVTREGLRRADEIKAGDMVLTHRGRFRPVAKTTSRWADDLITIKAKTLDAITLTKGHPALRMSVTSAGTGRRSLGCEWVEAGNLKPRVYKATRRSSLEPDDKSYDALTIPFITNDEVIREIDLREWYKPSPGILKKFGLEDTGETIRTKDGRSQPIRYRQQLDYEFGRLCGLWIAEGSYTRTRAQFSFHVDEVKYQDEVARLARERLGLNASIHKPKKSKIAIVNLSCPSLETFFGTMGKGAKNKRIPWWAWQAPTEFHRGLVSGWLDGDGCERRGTTISQDLAWGMRLIAARLGGWGGLMRVPCAGKRTRIHGREVIHRHDAWVLDLTTRRFASAEVLDDDTFGLWLRDSDPAPAARVYNFFVEEDESYVTTGGTLHNCSSFPRAANDDLVDMVTMALNYVRTRKRSPARTASALRTAARDRRRQGALAFRPR